MTVMKVVGFFKTVSRVYMYIRLLRKRFRLAHCGLVHCTVSKDNY